MSKRAIIIPLIVLVVAALMFFAINGRWTLWLGGRAEQETDDAYVRADMTPLSTASLEPCGRWMSKTSRK